MQDQLPEGMTISNSNGVAPTAPSISSSQLPEGMTINQSTPTTPSTSVNPNIKVDAETGQRYDQTDIKSPLAWKNSDAGKIFNTLASSEKGLSSDIAGAASTILPKSFTGLDSLDEASQEHAKNLATTAAAIKSFDSQGKDSSKLRGILQDEINSAPENLKDLYPALSKTNWQVVGDAGGTLLDILSAGTYGELAKGAESGALLTKAGSMAGDLATKVGISTTEKAAPAVAEQAGKQTLGQTLKRILFGTAIHSGIGAGVGYAGDVTQNLEQGKTGVAAITPGVGTATGAIVPALIGGVRAGVAIGKEEAPRFINSLIKPKTANFAYGKDPGRTVAELGITGNSLPDFEKNIGTAKNDIGQKIGAVYDNPANTNIKVNAQDDIAKIDNAINEAAKGGKQNQSVVTQLTNIKDGLLYPHQVNADGIIEKVPNSQLRDLSSLSPKEAQGLIQDVASQTRFTGSPSDDKTVNSTLKDIYSGIRDKINGAVKVNNPEILKLNQQYGDLTSAELATRNRDMILKRSNIVSLKAGGVGLGVGIASAIATHGVTLPLLLGAGSAGVEKALETTAVKTRIASWLANSSPTVLKSLTTNNPEVTTILRREFPNLVSKLGGGNSYSGVTSSGIKYNINQ